MPEAERSERLTEWLDARLGDVDDALSARVRAAITAPDAEASVSDAPRVLLRAAVAQLEPLAADGCVARGRAVDLLAVDALVTLACEALADTCESAEAIADAATSMIGPIAGTMPQLDGAA